MEKENLTKETVKAEPTTEKPKTNEEIIKEYKAKVNLELQRERLDAKKQELIDLEKDKFYQKISNFLKINGFPDLSMDETKCFVATCQTTGLNPFKREIYAIPFNKKDGNGEVTRSIMPVISYEVAVRNYRKVYPNDRFNASFKGEGENMTIHFSIDRWVPEMKDFIKDFWTPGYDPNIMEFARTKYNYQTKKQEIADVWKLHPQQMLTKCLVQRGIRYLLPSALEGLYLEEEVDNLNEPVSNDTHSNTYVNQLRGTKR